MMLEIDAKRYHDYFPTDPHLFVSESFTMLNAAKVERIVRLIQDNDKVQIGLVAGISNGVLKAPFSAPFGGFHYKNQNIYPSAVESYITDLLQYASKTNLKEVSLTLPPDIYSQSFNTKAVNVLLRSGFEMTLPEITNWVALTDFDGTYSHASSRTYYNQTIKNKLEFQMTDDAEDMQAIYKLIAANRKQKDRPIYMTFNDLLETGKLFMTDYFKVTDANGKLLAGAIFYRAHPKIAYAVLWGDATEGRPLRAMDFLIFSLWTFYKKREFTFIDLGTSTENGIPNEGLLRFKETHSCISSLRYSFTWKNTAQ